MAREFKVQATIVAEDKASATLRQLKGEFSGLHVGVDRLAASEKKLAIESAAAAEATRRLGIESSKTASATARISSSSNQAAAATRGLAADTHQAANAAARAQAQFATMARRAIGLGSVAAVFATLRRAVSLLADATDQTRADFAGLSKELSEGLAPGAERASTAVAALAAATREASRDTSAWSLAWSTVAVQLEAQFPVLSLLRAKIEELGEAERARAEKIAEFWSRGDAEATAYGDRIKAITAVTAELGVVLEEDVNAAIEANEGKIRLLTQAYDDHLISEQLWKEGTDALREKLAALRGETEQLAVANGTAKDSLVALSDVGFSALNDSAPGLVQTLKELIEVLRQVTIASQTASVAVASVGGGAGGSVRSTTSNRTSLQARTTNPATRGAGLTGIPG